MINFDTNATTATCPPAIDAMCFVMKTCHGNPSSVHCMGKKARAYLEDARTSICGLLRINEKFGRLIFTSGATESNNMVITGIEKISPEGVRFVTTTIEHPSVYNTFLDIKRRRGRDSVKYIAIEEGTGNVSLKSLESLLYKNIGRIGLVSVILANHEIGTIQPVSQLSDICHKYGVPIHVDATQAVGKIDIDVEKMGVDYLSFSGHKFHGPPGVGGLYMRSRRNPPSQIKFGGDQEFLHRPGTQNLPAIVGMAAALEDMMTIRSRDVTSIRKYILSSLSLSLPIRLNGDPVHCLPGTLNLTLPGVDARSLVERLSKSGICISRGSACKAGSKDGSNVLRGIGLTSRQMDETIRISFGRYNTMNDAKRLVESIRKNTIGVTP